jgi:hypothetical protein
MKTTTAEEFYKTIEISEPAAAEAISRVLIDTKAAPNDMAIAEVTNLILLSLGFK